MWSRPGVGIKEALENLQPMKIKEVLEEDVMDEEENDYNKSPRQSNFDIPKVTEYLRSIVEIASEQSTSILELINDVKSKYSFYIRINSKDNLKNQNDSKRSNIKFNVPKLSFKNNKVIKNPELGSGNLVMYAHNNFTLVANMMIGIKKAADSVLEYPEIRPEDFAVISKFYIVPWAVLHDKENMTKFKNCKFIDYAPQVFYNIRRLFRVKTQDYTRALGPHQLLSAYKGDFTGFTELASTGKSGSFFYYSYDSKYILKTISKDEFRFLKRILPSYYEHLKSHGDTLMARFYGCHKIIFYKSGIRRCKKFRFVIMNNVFSTGKRIHARYDLKGSVVGRQVLNNPNEEM